MGTAKKDVQRTDDLQLSRPAHALPHEQVAAELRANPDDGLSAADAASRLESHGPNELDDGPGVRPFKILVRQVANAMTLVS
jgi:magnesium-transporting ATPase (P-type)